VKPLGAALGVVVIGLVGWLVWPSAPGPLVLRAFTGTSPVTVTVERPRRGITDLDISASPGAFILVQADMPLMGYATPQVAATAAGGEHYTVAAVHLMTTGPWELRLTVTPRGGTRQDLLMPFDVTG
jgi:hypothetical protein